ncbi:2'-5' RNA ligase family protein [Streptococcus gallinaceus]|uniref:2'-5' RNA ligase family protein n=1 Tax=Streptococcus gallinaceus TaxID=165758 RepID=UPI0033917003
MSHFAVTFSSVGSFLRSGTVYLSPVLSSELYQCHARVYERLTVSADSLYSPGKWIPHMTLANYLAEDELPAAFALCQNQTQLEGRAVEIQLIKIQKDKQVQVVYQANFQE